MTSRTDWTIAIGSGEEVFTRAARAAASRVGLSAQAVGRGRPSGSALWLVDAPPGPEGASAMLKWAARWCRAGEPVVIAQPGADDSREGLDALEGAVLKRFEPPLWNIQILLYGSEPDDLENLLVDVIERETAEILTVPGTLAIRASGAGEKAAAAESASDEFEARPRELRRVVRMLERSNVLLVGPRRAGKTTFLHHVGAELRASAKRRFAYLAVDALEGETDFEAALSGAVARSRQASPTLLRMVRANPAVFAERRGRGDLDGLLWSLTRDRDGWVVAVDGLDMLLDGLASRGESHPEAFLRKVFAERAERSGGGLRWLVAAQTGLVRHGRDELSRYLEPVETVSLGALPAEMASELVHHLGAALGVALAPVAVHTLVAGLGSGRPGLLASAVSLLCDSRPADGAALGAEDARAAVGELKSQRRLLSGMLDTYAETLGESQAGLARVVMGEVARSPEGVTREQLDDLNQQGGTEFQLDRADRQRVLEVLLSEGALEKDGDRLRVPGGVLRDYWQDTLA